MNHTPSAEGHGQNRRAPFPARESAPAAWAERLGSYPWWVVGQIDASLTQIIPPAWRLDTQQGLGEAPARRGFPRSSKGCSRAQRI
ncbi:MAG: hypothetical protein RIS76_596 [Verrucomicrobiota bacterium]